MVTQEQIEELEAFDGGGARVLSVYLDLDPERQVRRSYRIVFEDLLKESRERLEEPTLEVLWLGDVQTLVVADGVHLSGSECPNCGRLEPESLATCPVCGAAPTPIG
jgi:peptide subunit release factor 1 (eRF1)